MIEAPPDDRPAWAIEVIQTMRKTMSRRVISELTTLGEGKIYRIENGKIGADEAELIYQQLKDRDFDAPPPVAPPPVVEPVAFQPPDPTPDNLPEPPTPPLATDPPATVASVVQDEVVPPFPEPAQPAPAPVDELPDFNDGIRRVGNSEIQTWKRCRRKWWLSYHRGLRPVHESILGPRAVGDRGHRALRRAYATDSSQRTDPRDALERELQIDWANTWNYYRRLGFDDIPPEEIDKFKKSSDLERVIIAGYVDWLAETGEDSNLTVVAPETYLEAELPEWPGVKLIGKIDVRVRRTYDGARLILDHKFVASISQAAQLLPMSEQMKMYVTLENLNTPAGEQVVGALYNMLRRVKRTAAAQPPFYQRVEQHHSPIELGTFRQRLLGELRAIWEAETDLAEGKTHHEVVYPTPSMNCSWDCPFVRVCPMFDDGSRVEAALEAHYVHGDPYDYYRAELRA